MQHSEHAGRAFCNDRRISTNLPGLLANEEMAKTVEPGALETCNGEQALEAVKLVRTRAQRIPSCAQSNCSPKGRIHLRRPPAIFIFCLQRGDGPYIPHRRLDARDSLGTGQKTPKRVQWPCSCHSGAASHSVFRKRIRAFRSSSLRVSPNGCPFTG